MMGEISRHYEKRKEKRKATEHHHKISAYDIAEASAEELKEVAEVRLLHDLLFIGVDLLGLASPLKRIKRTSLAEIV